METDLQSLQSLLYRLITARDGVTARLQSESALPAAGIEAVIRGDDRLGAVQRVEIYATAYFHRLLDCLKEDFPATLAALGSENFQQLIADYLAEFPPSEPSIFYAGRYLADFMGRHGIARERPFAEDLARLERTTIEVFHAPDASPLEGILMQSIPPERWAAFELQLHPAVVLLEVKWKVTEVLRAVNDAREWSVPVPEVATVIVFRQNARVYFRELEPAERPALALASRPVRFAEVCEAIANGSDADDPASEINRLFQRWLADGVLVSAGA